MEHRYDIEIEPEVKAWLDGLPREHYRAVERHADRLADAPTTLGEPHSRHLSGPVRELRFHLGPDAVRLTYWLAPGRRIAHPGLQEDPDARRARGPAVAVGAEGM
ncbi:type II toxin-antitoxin system RelE/ParE family toxin [Streptomyces sp. NPDC058603]|uniref:type II toxin-antitoxin system RelE/ParE family toxin n=1 Tax=unclassified Streptomyces TaxID=2593676 RepID=UPI0036565B10